MNSSSLMWAQSSCVMYISHMEIPGQISRAVYRPKCITYPQKVLHVHGNWVLTKIWHANMSLISYVCKTKFMATDRASKWHNPIFCWNQETYEITCSYGKAYWRASQWVASFFLSFILCKISPGANFHVAVNLLAFVATSGHFGRCEWKQLSNHAYTQHWCATTNLDCEHLLLNGKMHFDNPDICLLMEDILFGSEPNKFEYDCTVTI